MAGTAVVLLNRDLRVQDHPALAAALELSDTVVPLFVLDDAILGGGFAAPNRLAFLLESLTDLRQAMRRLGGDLVVRRGDPVRWCSTIAREVDAASVVATADVTGFAARRQQRLAAAAASEGRDLHLVEGIGVVAPGRVLPTGGGDHFKVFTPYLRAWERMHRRPVLPAPAELTLPAGVDPGDIPELTTLTDDPGSPDRPLGGERAGRDRLDRFLADELAGYDDGRNALPTDGTSRLSPYLHLGCLSASEVVQRCSGRPGAEPFVRQLCWRDFYHQVAAAFPRIATADYRTRGDHWSTDDDAFAAWCEGRTGYPVVDAGMRQLRLQGWMHNRARLIAASFLVKDLRIDWRRGARHFERWLVDGDIVQNAANWQWTAGTGNDTRPNRVFNPTRQAERFDPDGAYVRRFVPELAHLSAREIHRPWTLAPERRPTDYPAPIVDHDAVAGAFLQARRGGIQEQLPL